MRNSLALHRRLDSASAHDNECFAEQNADVMRRMHVLTVFCILVTLAVIVYWLFLTMAMPETQFEPAIFLDR